MSNYISNNSFKLFGYWFSVSHDNEIVITDDDSPGYVFENDIVVYDDDHDYSSPDAVGSVSRLWAKNGTEVIIPYTMPEGVTSTQLHEIHKAMDEFHKKTCIR